MTNPIRSGWSEHPDYKIEIDTSDRPICMVYQETVIAESRRALLLREQVYAPVYYFPREDVRMEMFEPIEKLTVCPFKGEARHWRLRVGDEHIEVSAWSYEDPFEEVKQIKDHIAFYPEAGELQK